MLKQDQKGNTLIIVLIVLLLVTIIGAIAVRSSILGLSLATSNQINNLLLQNNDAVLFELKDENKLSQNLVSNQVYGYFNNPANAQDELTFCYRASNSRFFSLANASVTGSTKLGVGGYCQRNWFSSGRSAILTQVYVKSKSGQAPLTNMTLGTSGGATETAQISPRTMSVTTISVLPAFASATDAQIQSCFRNSTGDTVQDCFTALNIPLNVQSSEFKIEVSEAR
ncbi:MULTISPECIES: pilus assembly protein PilX [unclassified Acinetobacter]|uniref:pilus assembly protein PilX n=1 Tax=unclassified Acinetobacter TaxID=196816 RepID=UPI0035B6D2E0